jgi:PAS domain S-box-containing protein
MNAVIPILQQNRETIVDQIVGSLLEEVPRYALADPNEIRAGTELLFDEIIAVIETGSTVRLTDSLSKIASLRIAQGFTATDFLRALTTAYPVVRGVMRKSGPRQDVSFSKMFEEVETALFHMLALASNIFASNLSKHAQAELDQQRKRLHAAQELSTRVIASLASGVFVLEGPPTDKVLLWSARMTDITGVQADEMIGKNVAQLAQRFPTLPFQELYETVKSTDRLPLTKVQLKLGNGVTRSVFVRAERLRQMDSSQIAGTVVIVDDITEREMLIDSFSRYVSKEVVQRLLSRAGRSSKLEGERRACSVLFADIRGFTGISERITPEALHELLNQYFRVMIDRVSAHDGIIDKFIGDKIMAVFTGSEAEGALAAVRAAHAIQEEIERLNKERASASAEPITVGIGVNTGTVVMGTVGSEERMSFTVIGDAVNVADRLQSLASAGETYIGARTSELVGKAFELEELGSRTLKGRSNPELMFKLLAPKT